MLGSTAINVADVKLPTRVQTMFDADAVNTQVSPTLIAALHPWAVTAFDETADLFRLLYDQLGNWSAEAVVREKLSEIAKAHCLSDDELSKRLQSGKSSGI